MMKWWEEEWGKKGNIKHNHDEEACNILAVLYKKRNIIYPLKVSY